MADPNEMNLGDGDAGLTADGRRKPERRRPAYASWHQQTVIGPSTTGASHLPPGYSALTCHVPPVTLTKKSSKQPLASVFTVR